MFSTFVINLDKDTERMDFMEKQLNKASIQYVRHAAIDGRNYVPQASEYDQNLALKQGGHILLPGEVGCALSHAQIIARIVEDKIPFSLVLEDDILIPENFKELVEKQVQKQKKWEYLLFDYPTVGLPFLRAWLLGVKINYQKQQGIVLKWYFLFKHCIKAFYIIPLSLFEYFRDRLRAYAPGPVVFFRPVYYAGAYLVTYQGAQKLHALSTPVRYTADHLPNRARLLTGLRFRCYAPLVVSQQRKKFGSSILKLSAEDMQKILP